MSSNDDNRLRSDVPRFRVVDLNFVSFYFADYAGAIDFYTRVFGPPDSVNDSKTIHGWKMGATWLTLFPDSAGAHPGSGPRGTEFAVQVADVAEVDRLHDALVAAGAVTLMAPHDTTMYEPMRFACVDDPFGVRVDVYCLAGTYAK